MPLQLSGQISFSNIANEKNITVSNLSLNTLATTNFNIDSCNPSTADNGAPHSLSEWFGYNHRCVTPTGPELVEETWLGIYRDTFEACERGQFNDSDFTSTVYVDRENSVAYADPLGNRFQDAGIYYSLEMSSAAVLEGREGRLVYAPCGGFPPKK